MLNPKTIPKRQAKPSPPHSVGEKDSSAAPSTGILQPIAARVIMKVYYCARAATYKAPEFAGNLHHQNGMKFAIDDLPAS